jgi:hypothetical protein
MNPKKKLSLALTLGSVLAVGMAGVAIATHVHPADTGALADRFALVPAFNQCTSPTSTHGTPLSAPSCKTTPGSAASATLTTGTGTVFKMRSSVLVQVYCTNGETPPCPAAGDQESIKVVAAITDVRCKASIANDSTLCPSANSAGGKDYAGQIQFNATVRITDHYNQTGSAPCSSTFSCSATVVDLQFPVTGTCAATSGNASIGSNCSINTEMGPLVPEPCPPCPDPVKEGTKMNIELGQAYVNDGGTDGLASSSPNTVFLRQGIYSP